MRGSNCWILLLIFCGCVSVQGQPSFFRKEIAVLDRPNSIVIGDFNNDSKPDLAVGGWAGTTILLNAGGGNFEHAIYVDTVISPQLAAHFDGDGRLDLIGVSTGPNPAASILLGRGDGTFQPPRDLLGGQHDAATGDFNKDAKLDLILYNVSTGDTFLLLGNGDGTFHSATLVGRALSDQEVLTIAVDDINRDGHNDLVLFDGWGVRILLGTGDGTFRSPIDAYVERMPGSNTHYSSSGILLADFNRDGLLDIATRSNIMLGNGDGTFQAPRFFLEASSAISPYAHPSAAADLNGDGHPDLVMTYGFSAPVSVFAGRGDGTLLASVEYGPGGAIVVADVDGDGLPDLVCANLLSNSVSLLLNGSAKRPE